MPTHRRPAWFTRTRERGMWIALVAVLTVLVGGTAYAVATSSQVDCDAATSTPNPDGTVTIPLRCRVTAMPQPSQSPTASPSPTDSPTPTPSPTSSPTATTGPSPTPPSTTSPTPSPTTTTTGPTTQCLKLPSRCGFPDATNTGPNGLLPVSTRTTYTVANERVTGVQINGCVQVYASGVTFTNVFFKADGCFWGVHNLSSGLTISDSEITCGGFNGTAVGSSGFTLTRVDIHNCENGLDVGSNVTMTDSWIHDMEIDGGAHTDGVQIGQGSRNLTFRHNTITVPTPGATSAIISWDEGGDQQQQVVIDGNLLSGGTYTLYCPRQGPSDTRVTNNRYGVYEYGYSNSCVGNHVSAWSGNVIDSTGAPLAAA